MFVLPFGKGLKRWLQLCHLHYQLLAKCKGNAVQSVKSDRRICGIKQTVE